MAMIGEISMGRRAFLGGAAVLMVGLAGCASPGTSGGGSSSSGSSNTGISEAPKSSDDPHVQYIKNYKGKNAANIGYTALNAMRMDYLGGVYIHLVYVDSSGRFVNPEDEEQLKEYVVFDQNLPANTQVDIVLEKDSDGNEYEHVAAWQTHEEVVLAVKRTGTTDPTPVAMTPIDATPDQFTGVIRDYVGRNLAECGYVTIVSKLADSYGPGYLELIPEAEDGAYIDPTNPDDVANYVVTAQDAAPNTQFTMEPSLDADGEPYNHIVSSQSLSAITLTVRRLEDSEG